jgi:hypothetical protein
MKEILGELLYRLSTIVASCMIGFIVFAEIMNYVDMNQWYSIFVFTGAFTASIFTSIFIVHWSWKLYGIKPLI